MSEYVCQGCGESLPPKTRQGRDQKWCSERCRRTTLYVRHCVDCGTRLSSSDGNGPNAPQRCVRCSGIVNGAKRKVWTREAIVAAIRDWAAEHDVMIPAVADWGGGGTGLGHRRSDYQSEPDRWPNYFTVLREFGEAGGWAEAIRAAGFEPRRQGQRERVAA